MSFRVGRVELVPLLDAVGELGDLADLYPDVPPEAWAPYRALYPELFSESRVRLPCACYVIRSGDTVVLVDTGVGPPGLWDWASEVEGLLPSRLAEHGLSRDDIDVVFLTHLHIDHIGWNTDENGAVSFPRARYLVRGEALAFARARAELPHIRRCVEPLVDRLERLEGETDLAAGVVAFDVSGHYPGHMGVRVTSDGAEAVLIADAAVHPALLDHPDWRYVYDLDPDESISTRRRLIAELVDRDVLVACGHYPNGGIGRIVRKNRSVVWEPL